MWETRRVFQADGGILQGYPQERHVHSRIYTQLFARQSTHAIAIHLQGFTIIYTFSSPPLLGYDYLTVQKHRLNIRRVYGQIS